MIIRIKILLRLFLVLFAILLGLMVLNTIFSETTDYRSDSAKFTLKKVRECLNDYKIKHGKFPENLEDLATTGYFEELPWLRLGVANHDWIKHVEKYKFLNEDGTVDSEKLQDTGQWLYDSNSGIVIIDCVHKDHNGDMVWEWWL